MLSRALTTTTRRACQIALLRPIARQCHNSRSWAYTAHFQRHFHGSPRRADESSETVLSAREYHKLSDHAMESLLEQLEEILDDIADPSYEVEYSSGVLTLKLGGKGTYVINKQPPNLQIWLSSPVSGPKRYDYNISCRKWLYARDGVSLEDLLQNELRSTLEREIEIDLGASLC